MSNRGDLIEKCIEKVMTIYGLSKAFERGEVRSPETGIIEERWRPTIEITRQDYSSGERIITAVLLDLFHEEYGLLDLLDKQSLAESTEKGRRPAEMIWSGAASIRELRLLDNDLLKVLVELLEG